MQKGRSGKCLTALLGGEDTMRIRFLPETEQAQKLEMP